MAKDNKEKTFGFEKGFSGIMKGLGDLVEKLKEISEKGEEIKKAGEFDIDKGKGLKGVYGFNIKIGIGDKGKSEFKAETFGNIKKDKTTGEPVVQEVREPMVDIFEEKDHVLIVSEMPGISSENIQLDVKDDILTLHAEKGDKKYHKEVLLPGSFKKEQMTLSCNNGIVEIKVKK